MIWCVTEMDSIASFHYGKGSCDVDIDQLSSSMVM